MPLEIANPTLSLRFSVKETGAPAIPFRFAVLEVVETLIVTCYTDEANTKLVGSREILTLDSASNNLVLDSEPSELYSNGIKMLDYSCAGRFVSLPVSVEAGSVITALTNHIASVYLTDNESLVSQIFFSSTVLDQLYLLGDNAVTGELAQMEFSTDGVTYGRTLYAILDGPIYVRPRLRSDLFDTVRNITDESLVAVCIDTEAAGDLSVVFDGSGLLDVTITGHDEDTCGIEYTDLSGETADWYGHSGIVAGLNPSRTNTIKAFYLVDQVKQYVGTVAIVRIAEIPVVTRLGNTLSADLNVASQAATITPGTNPVMQG